jgi:hypothetical protein
MSVADRLAGVRAGLVTACQLAGRPDGDVSLIAVSKVHPTAAIEAAMAAGQLDFGESYAQELRDKARQMQGPRWHFVGRIQRNKLKYIATVAHRVHALESVPQAEALSRRLTESMGCLVSVNIGREAQKSGVMPEHVIERCAALQAVPRIHIVGLMCLPPQREDPEDVAPFFEEMCALATRGRAAGLALTELSMGMSHDYRVAVRHGATWVRVGTAIFGPRPART